MRQDKCSNDSPPRNLSQGFIMVGHECLSQDHPFPSVSYGNSQNESPLNQYLIGINAIVDGPGGLEVL